MALHILLIEDEPNIAEAIRFILSRDGYEVRVLGNGQDALTSLADRMPDLVILDLMLPGISGLDVLTQLRNTPKTADIPVMMLTARGQSQDRQAAEQAGVSHFMTKPFANHDVREAVRQLLIEKA